MQRMRWLLTSIHLLVFLLALSIPVAIFNGTLFSWHPTLMALAFLGFMTEGVTTAILFRAKDGNERVAAIQKHLIWQLLGFACLLGGFAAIYRNKARVILPYMLSFVAVLSLAASPNSSPMPAICALRVKFLSH